MIMNDVEVYKARMDVTMTTEEKLFFAKELDMSKYQTIIDFGGANGSLLYALTQLCPEIHYTKKIIVDNNPQMKTEYPLDNLIRVPDIAFATQHLEGNALLICSSVLHECSRLMARVLMVWAAEYCKAVVIRDMYYESAKQESDSYFDYPAYKVIMSNQELRDRFLDILSNCEYTWLQRPREVLTHFILKYTYTENWETEREENYFSNNAAWLAEELSARDRWKYIKKENYTLPYKKVEAKRVFNWDLPITHTKRILVKK